MTAYALEVANLSTEFSSPLGAHRAVEDVSFHVRSGEIMALVGESGSGKSVTGLSIMGLLDPPGRMASGVVRVGGEILAHGDPRAMRAARGARIAMIFQDPMTTLNPVMRIAAQMIEALQVHDPRLTRPDAHHRVEQALRAVGIPSPRERLAAYPHELSGGMRQRVVIAIALLNRPAVVIADEPTTALDVTTQGQIVHEIKTLCRSQGTALVWITHDLAVVASLADTVSIFYAGRIVEQGPVEAILHAPRHPYTRGLVDSVPSIDDRRHRLRSIPGIPPARVSMMPGCKFAPRCGRRQSDCAVEPPMAPLRAGRALRCWHPLAEAAG